MYRTVWIFLILNVQAKIKNISEIADFLKFLSNKFEKYCFSFSMVNFSEST